MLKERDQRGSNGDNLLRRNVHQGYVFRRLDRELVLMTNSNQLVDQLAPFQLGAGLCNDVISFFDRREEYDLVGDFAFLDHTVRAFQETVLIGTCISSQRVDQTDVRTFWRFNRTDTTIMGRVYVTHFEACTLTRQTARAERRNTTLVSDLRQRVVLVHELRQLAGTEELLDRRGNRLCVDQVLRHQPFAFCHRQTFFDRTLNAHQTYTELVLGHFTHAAYATVAQVVDIVDDAFAVTDVDQGLQHRNDVLATQHPGTLDLGPTDTAVELHPTYGRQVVALRREKQIVEQRLGSVLGWRLARSHHAVDLNQRFELIGSRVDLQRVGNERAAIDVVGVQRLEANHLRLDQLGQYFDGQLGVALGNDLPSRRVHDGLCRGAAQDVVHRHIERFDAGLVELIDMARGNPATLLDYDLAVLVGDIERGDLAAQTLRNQLQTQRFALNVEHVGVVERIKDFFGAVIQRAQKHRRRQLAATVDTHEDGIFRIELEVQPRATVRNDTSGIQQLARTVGLAPIVIEENARRAVQLRHDDALSTVDDEGTVLGHQGDFPHVDFLLLDVLDRLARRFLIKNDQADFYPQRHGEGHAAQHAFLNVESRVAQAIADILQRRIAGIADYRKNGFEGCMQANIAELILGRSRLQEFAVRIQLDGQKIRHVHHVR